MITATIRSVKTTAMSAEPRADAACFQTKAKLVILHLQSTALTRGAIKSSGQATSFCTCDLDRNECRELFLALPLTSPIWRFFSLGFAEIAKLHAVDLTCERSEIRLVCASLPSLL